jgi:tryptophanyl-tRNA synthetase
MTKQRTLTGYRPTGKLHLGHWFGNLQNMLQMQHDYDAYYFIADWHALTTHWADPGDVRAFSEDMVLDWVAAGLDPEICTIYRQSDVPEVAELTLYFSMVTPMP